MFFYGSPTFYVAAFDFPFNVHIIITLVLSWLHWRALSASIIASSGLSSLWLHENHKNCFMSICWDVFCIVSSALCWFHHEDTHSVFSPRIIFVIIMIFDLEVAIGGVQLWCDDLNYLVKQRDRAMKSFSSTAPRFTALFKYFKATFKVI